MLFPRPIRLATLIHRPNRFVGRILLDEQEHRAHFPNTGPLKKVLALPCQALVMQGSGTLPYQVQAVAVDHTYVGIYSALANTIAEPWIRERYHVRTLQKEVTFHASRFDFAWQTDGMQHVLEVKSVTYTEGSVAMFPDTPSTRAHKHLEHLLRLSKEGVTCHLLFVVQRDDVTSFASARQIDPEFHRLLCACKEAHIDIRAVRCHVDASGITIQDEIPVILS